MPEVAGDAGLLVDARDVSSIANGLMQMITDKGLRSKLKACAKSNAASFNWHKSAKQLISIFEKGIKARSSHLV